MERRQHTSRPSPPAPSSTDEYDEYTALVLALVDSIPPGHATTYGDIAARVRAWTGRGGPRQVGRVLALHGAGAPWWRVVRADGTFSMKHGEEARLRHLQEGTALLDTRRVDLKRSGWDPEQVTIRPSEQAL